MRMDAVTVTTNDGQDIERMFDCSPLVQSFDRIVVVDNVCDDGSPEQAEERGATVVHRTERGGDGARLNQGARGTRGPVFCPLPPRTPSSAGSAIRRRPAPNAS